MDQPIEVTVLSKFISEMPSVNIISYYSTNHIVDVSEDYHIRLNTTGNVVRADKFKLTFSENDGTGDV